MRKIFFVIFARIVPVTAFLGVAFVIAGQISASKPQVKMMQKQKNMGTLVTTKKFEASNEQIIVKGSGVVIAAQTLALTAEVSGKLVSLNPKLVQGGFIEKGTVVGQIEKDAFETNVVQRKMQLEDVKYNIKIEEGRQKIAKQEWELLDEDFRAKANKDLLLRIPHMAKLKASLKYAQKALEQAELDLKKTAIIAPFNAIVLEKFVEEKQLVSSQTKLATLVGSDYLWVQVNVPINSLNYVKLPDINGENGSTARILQKVSDKKTNVHYGKIVKMLGKLDQVGRLASLLVEVKNPFGITQIKDKTSETLASTSESTNNKFSSINKKNIPLFINSFVQVEIKGITLENMFVIPQSYIREGNLVWIMNNENKLEFREIDIEWYRAKDVLVANGLKSGEKIVTSRISKPVAGVQLRTESGREKDKPRMLE